MPDDTDGTHDGSFPARRRTLLGALAGGVGLSALGAAAGQDDQEEPAGQGDGQMRRRRPRAAQMMAPLSGEEHDVETEGDGAFYMRARGSRVHWTLLVENLQNVTAAHIHDGSAGESGPIAITLVEYPAFGDGADAEDATRTAGEDEPLIVSGTMRVRPGQAGAGQGNVTAGNATTAPGQTNATAGNDTGVGEGGLFGDDAQSPQNQTGMAGNATGGMAGNQTGWMPSGQTRQHLAGGETQTTVERATLNQVIQNPSEYYVNVHTTEHPDGALRGQLYDLSSVTQPPGQMPAGNQTQPGMADNQTAVGGPGNATNETDGGILDGGDGGGGGGDGNGGGIFD